MELNQTKCKEMTIDFRKNVTVIPPLEMNSQVFERVECYKLLELWIDDNLMWSTNTWYIVKKKQVKDCRLLPKDIKSRL